MKSRYELIKMLDDAYSIGIHVRSKLIRRIIGEELREDGEKAGRRPVDVRF